LLQFSGIERVASMSGDLVREGKKREGEKGRERNREGEGEE